MITGEDIRAIISTCKEEGYDIRIRDVVYVIACEQFADRDIVYKSLFGNNDGFLEYDNSKQMTFLFQYLRPLLKKGSEAERNYKEMQMSFNENRAAMIRLIDETQAAMDDGLIEPKDGLKIIADIRVKLNDKFSIVDEEKDQMVIVEPKYNHICKYGYECYLPTKEDLLKMYNIKL